MALPAPNVTFDVYTGFNPANPYAPPTVPARLCNQQGFLRQHVRNGRFGFIGYGQPLHWTTLLLLPPGSDVRDGWDGNANVYREANGDTILMHDYPVPGTCSAFVVVFVQNRGGALRCYLDRTQPSYRTPCPRCPGGSGGGAATPCCANLLPALLHATFTGGTGSCTCLNGLSTPLTWNASLQQWIGAFSGCGAAPTTMVLTCASAGPPVLFNLAFLSGGGCTSAGGGSSSATCSPAFSATFSNISFGGCCFGTVNITVTP